MTDTTAVQHDAPPIVACTISRDVQIFDLLIEDMETELGEAWGDLSFEDARQFFRQPDSGSLKFVAVAIDQEDEGALAMIADLIKSAKTQGVKVILIADEVQAGMARTGKLFAMEHAGVAADLVTMAKGLAGGFPLSAVTGRSEVVDAAPTGGIGGTYAGNPLAVAAAHAVLDVIVEEDLCARAEEVGNALRERLDALAARQGLEAIGDVRGLGAMVAFELVTDRATRTPDAALTQAIVAEAEARGLIILPCGTHGNVVRLLPPLTIPMAQVDEALDILEASIEAAVGQTRAAA